MTAPAFAGAPRVAAAPDRAERVAVDRWRVALVVVGALALAAGIATLDGRPVGVFHDDAMYVILARSLATLQGYRFLNIPGAPPATHFPPGYPAFLALLSLIAPAFPANLLLFKAANAVLLAGVAVLVARFARARFVDARWAVALGLVSAVSVPLLILGTLVLSEPLFLLALVALLAALERVAERGCGAREAVLLGVGIAACTLVRSHGIVLIPAAALVLIARRRWRVAALVSGSAMLALVPWQLWSARYGSVLPAPLLGSYGSYAGWWVRGIQVDGLSMVPATLGRTIPEATGMLAVLFSPARSAAAHTATLIALAALTAAGAWASRRRAPVTLLFLGGYLAIVLLWPFPPSRFIWGIWPLLLLLPVAGAAWAARLLATAPSGRRPVAFALLAAFAWVATGYGAYELRAVRGQWWSTIARANTARIVPAVQWTLQHAAPDALLAAEDEGALYLYTGRRAVPVLSFTTAQYLRDHGAAENAGEGLAPILAAYPVRAVLVGTLKTYEAAGQLTLPPSPRLAPPVEFPGGAAFPVLDR